MLDEINRQIAQDLALTNYVDTQTASIADAMQSQAAAAAALAGQYQPVTQQQNATLDANAQQAIAQDAALTNAVGADQSGALAALIAKSGGVGAELMGNLRGAAQTQHRDYARHVQSLRPQLEEQRRREKLAEELQRTQMEIGRQQFLHGVKQDALNNQFRYDNLAATMDMAAANNAAPSAPNPADQSKYGYGLHARYDKDLDSLYGSLQPIPKIDPETGKPLVGSDGRPVMVSNPNRRWRDTINKLTGLGINGGQAVLLASKWLPDRLKIHGRNSPAVIYNLLKSGELGFKLSDNVAKQVLANIGPNAWNQRRGFGAQANQNLQTVIDMF